MTTVVQIDTLDMEGFTQDEARRAANVFETRLAELLTHHGLPPNKTASDLSDIRLDQLPRSAGSAESIGRALAEALFGRVWQ